MPRKNAYGKSKKRCFTKHCERRIVSLAKKATSSLIEYKHHSVTLNAYAATTATLTPLTSIAQGDQSTERIGHTINPTSVILRYRFRGTDGTIFSNDQYNNVRVIVFQWFADAANDPPSALRILNSYGTVPYCTEQYDTRDSDKYKILYDKCHKMETTAAYYDTSSSTAYTYTSGTNTIRVKLKNLRKVVYKNFLSTPGTGAVYVLFFSDSSVTPHPVLHGTAKLTYSDL